MYKLLSIKIGECSLMSCICGFLAFTLFIINCTPESFSGSEALEDQYDLRAIGENELGIYDALEIFRTLRNSDEFQSSDDVLSYVIGEDAFEQTASIRQEISDEVEHYKILGFEGYLNDAEAKGNMPVNMKHWLMTFKENLIAFMDTQPDENMVTSYISNLDNFMFSDSYSSSELELIERIQTSLKGFSKYYYLHFYDSNLDLQNDLTSIDFRDSDCNFIEALLCTFLWVAVFAAMIKIIAAAIISAAGSATVPYTITKGGIIVSSGTSSTVEVAYGFGIGFTALLPGSFFVNAWTSYYEWCCGKKEVILCESPLGSVIKKNGCNNYQIRFYGAGDYKNTVWQNENTIPLAAITPTPVLDFTVSAPGQTSLLRAISILCTELPSGNVETYSGISSGILDEFSIVWDIVPQSTISLGGQEDPQNPDMLYITVKPSEIITGFSNSYTYAWSITGSHQIIPLLYSAEVDLNINDLGPFTISVVVKDECTGSTQSLSKIINLIQ